MIPVCIYMVCWTRFTLCKMLGFPIGKHHFSQSGKRVQQTMVLDSPKGWPNDFSSEFRFIFIGFPCSFWLEFLNIRKVSSSIAKLNVTKVGNPVQQIIVLDSPDWCQKRFLQNSGSFSLDIHDFLNGIPEHPESKFLHWETQGYEDRKPQSKRAWNSNEDEPEFWEKVNRSAFWVV